MRNRAERANGEPTERPTEPGPRPHPTPKHPPVSTCFRSCILISIRTLRSTCYKINTYMQYCTSIPTASDTILRGRIESRLVDLYLEFTHTIVVDCRCASIRQTISDGDRVSQDVHTTLPLSGGADPRREFWRRSAIRGHRNFGLQESDASGRTEHAHSSTAQRSVVMQGKQGVLVLRACRR